MKRQVSAYERVLAQHTALAIRPDLTSFVTYDKRLLDAAAASGLRVDSPA